VAYVCVAWLVAPGFFDGFAPPAPYHWVTPPFDVRSSNQPPTSGEGTIAAQNGVSEAGHVFTTDQQAAVTFPSQSFATPPNGASVALEIKPVTSFPDLVGILPAGNVYLVSTSTRLISPIVVTLRYGSQQQGPPSQIFAADGPTSRWKSLGSISSSVPYTVAASTQTLGYFVVGYPRAPASTAAPAASGGAGAGGPPVPALVAGAAAVLVLLAGIPLMAARRRAAVAAGATERPDQAAPARERPEQLPVQNRGGARRRGGQRRRR